jgi:hypothetical protein
LTPPLPPASTVNMPARVALRIASKSACTHSVGPRPSGVWICASSRKTSPGFKNGMPVTIAFATL